MSIASLRVQFRCLAAAALLAACSPGDQTTWYLHEVPRSDDACDNPTVSPAHVWLTGLGLATGGPVVGWYDDCQASHSLNGTVAPALYTNLRWSRWSAGTWHAAQVPVPAGQTFVMLCDPRLGVAADDTPWYAFESGMNADNEGPHPIHAFCSNLNLNAPADVDGNITVIGANGLPVQVHDVVGDYRIGPTTRFGLGFMGSTPICARGIASPSPGGFLKRAGALVTTPTASGPPGTVMIQTLDYASRLVAGSYVEATVYSSGTDIFWAAGNAAVKIQSVYHVGNVAVAIGLDGKTHIAVGGYVASNGMAGSVRYLTNATPDGSWASAEVDARGENVSILIDPSGSPCIAYWREGTALDDGLRFARPASATDLLTWPPSTRVGAANGFANSGRTCLAADAHGSIGLFYFDAQPGQERMMLATLDATPPITTAAAAPALPASGWYNSDVTVTLTAREFPSSGVKEIRCFVEFGNGTPTSAEQVVAQGPAGTTTVSANVVVSSEGVNVVHFHAVDWAGNVEPDGTLTVKLDKTRPTVSADIFSTIYRQLPAGSGKGQGLPGDPVGGSGIEPPHDDPVWIAFGSAPYVSGEWTKSPPVTSSEFTCVDPLPPGVNANSGLVSCPSAFTVTAEGVTTITHTVADVAGNQSDPWTAVIRIDTTPPNLLLRPHAITSDGQEVWPLTTNLIEGQPWYDARVDHVEFEVTSCDDPAPWTTATSGYEPVASGAVNCPSIGQRFSASSIEGRQVVQLPTITDAAGNTRTLSRPVYIDRHAPSASFTMVSQPDGFGWFTNPIRFRIDGVDDSTVSPCSGIDPACDCGKVVERLAADGFGVDVPVTNNVFDRAGNRPAVEHATLSQADSTPPSVNCHVICTQATGDPLVLHGATRGVEGGPSLVPVSVEVSASDAGSGVIGWLFEGAEVLTDMNGGSCWPKGVSSPPTPQDDIVVLPEAFPGAESTHFKVRLEWCFNGYLPGGILGTGRTYRFKYRAIDRVGNVGHGWGDLFVTQ